MLDKEINKGGIGSKGRKTSIKQAIQLERHSHLRLMRPFFVDAFSCEIGGKGFWLPFHSLVTCAFAAMLSFGHSRGKMGLGTRRKIGQIRNPTMSERINNTRGP